MRSHLHSALFFGYRDEASFIDKVRALLLALKSTAGSFTGDNLITFDKNLSFLADEKFMASYDAHAATKIEKGIIWRTAVLAWAAKNALRLPGDFVECACYKGTSARIVCDYLGFAQLDRTYYLYDLFDHDPAMPHHRMTEHGEGLFETVKARFEEFPNVVVTRGAAPASFAKASPGAISFLHVDMNNAPAEAAVIEALFDRIVPGAAIILDDYGWRYYRAQKQAHDAWFAARGYSILELPTGQGLVIK
ncbi:MAG: class I SAM-dependent methyltransferase [Pseudomonadota bacterium]|uniref:class I SAM-dependent methyltransferase n=1 Tax=Phenylobacterium sp. TaxID=1871053 RepID=UPI0025EDDD3A|nr:class I SAM-dependent methyltransferase [Phenylobacterium sp.]MBT9471760.1 class I SAM-dependent methyltransferase [Phenylobacterium sp.]